MLEITSNEQLAALRIASGAGVVVHFKSDWYEPCKQVSKVLEELSKTRKDVQFVQVDSEGTLEVSEAFRIDFVPTVVFLSSEKDKKAPLAIVKGAKIPLIVKTVSMMKVPLVQKQPAKTFEGSASPPATVSLKSRIETLLKQAPVMLFMKGDRESPRCGFSSQMIEILNKHKINYMTFDILEDDSIRQGLKEYSNWPTYPQLYIEGKLIGGLDIVMEMIEDGDFEEYAAKYSLEGRLVKLIKSHRVMLFMKGTPDEPKCGFSNKMIGLLKQANCTDYGTFDILEDPDVRQGLKEYSNWPTFPQLYIDGKLIGGLDIVTEMMEDGDLDDILH